MLIYLPLEIRYHIYEFLTIFDIFGMYGVCKELAADGYYLNKQIHLLCDTITIYSPLFSKILQHRNCHTDLALSYITKNRPNIIYQNFQEEYATLSSGKTASLYDSYINAYASLYKQYRNVIATTNKDLWVWNEERLLWERMEKYNEKLIDIQRVVVEIDSRLHPYFKVNKRYANLMFKLSNSAVIKLLYTRLFTDSVSPTNARSMIIPCKDGMIIDLATKKYRRRTKKDLCTFALRISYQLDLSTELDIALLDITNGDVDLIFYLQYILGYCLTDLTSLASMFIFYDHGSAAWDLLLQIANILGEYSAIGDKTIFFEHTNKTEKLISVYNKRLVIHSAEQQSTRKNGKLVYAPQILNSRLPEIVTGKSINTRGKGHRTNKQIKATCKLILHTNHVIFPIKDDVMNSMVIVPMYGTTWNRVDNDTLFSWLVEGAHRVYNGEICSLPGSVIAAKHNYENM